MAEASGVLVLGEVTGDKLSPTSQELLAAARQVADDLAE